MGGGGSTYDYGFRIYNPGIAKFLSVDPLTVSYPWYTPYQFAGNMPVWAIDLDGLEPYKNAYKFANNGNPKLNLFHSSNLINMEFSINPTSFNSLGWQRDKNHFWNQYKDTPLGKEALSKSNLKLIEKGYSPIVDDNWNAAMRQFSNDGEMGEVIHHHHHNKGKMLFRYRLQNTLARTSQ